MKKIILILLIFGMLFILNLGTVYAALPSPSADFEMDFSGLGLLDGEWRISVISIPLYKDSTKKSIENFEIIKSTYLDVKNLCGVPDYYEIKVTPSLDEIERLEKIYPYLQKSNVSLGTYNKKYELYEFYKDEKYAQCVYPGGCENYQNLNETSEYQCRIKKLTDFGTRHYTMGGFYPHSCEMENNLCVIHILENDKGPYFIVLEKMDSKNEIYFSEPVDIKWEINNKVQWQRSQDNVYPLKIDNLNFYDSNSLNISFKGLTSFTYESQTLWSKISCFLKKIIKSKC